MNHHFKQTMLALKDAIFPLKCLACGKLYLREIRPFGDLYGRLVHLLLCGSCRKDWTQILSPLCPRCGVMFDARDGEDHLCGDCLTRPGAIRFARAVGVYGGSFRALVQAFKYKGKLQSVRPLGDLLWDLYCQCYGDHGMRSQPPDMIMPVPLHGRRLRKRTFNQAWMLIRNWPVRMNGQTVPLLFKDGLIRHRWTEPQAGLDAKSRRANLKGAFSVRPGLDVRDKTVLLIDDVYTTGATAEACAAVLVKQGAVAVDILTLTRA